MIDVEKRKRVMKRSMQLGHCICNPKKSCPCDVFKEKDICPCAGEREHQAVEKVDLTTLVEKTGCASKINQNDLKLALDGLPEISDPRLIVGSNTCDDAGVFCISDDMALVQTVDVFTPVVDDPYTFGQIAAANSLSDVYAMGGKPITALSIISFPIETVSPRVMTQMLRGGMDKMKEAGAVIAGGHSINDKEPKLGYSITGLINPDRIITNSNAQPGDLLILTKPLGTGIISFANQLGKASEQSKSAAAKSMTELNKKAAEVMLEIGVNSATDVTGFGLFGHLGEMVSQSGVSAEIYISRVPIFEGVSDYVLQGMISGGIERNMEHSSQYVRAVDDVPYELLSVLYDPQTSGGLLISVCADKANILLRELNKKGIDSAAIIGKITDSDSGVIYVYNDGDTIESDKIHKINKEKNMEDISCCCSNSNNESCCESPLAADTNSDAGDSFSTFMGIVMTDGAISVRNKELITIALSLLSKCEPCLKIHINKAKQLGVTDDEINEAIWLAISFGGAPLKMFYELYKSKQ